MVTSFTQFACYNTYFISTTELSKLESDVEPREVVEVLADCPGSKSAYRSVSLHGTQWAEVAGEGSAASDQTSSADVPRADGCTAVPVSTANPVTVRTSDGGAHRVTPFNFVMSESQLVSPEYDLLLSMSVVEGADVKQFSTWKTVATITGVSVLTIGTFIGISLLAPEGDGFK
ncbi:MAG: hypothetical protein H0U74_05825 [Bradymonadaceae bacterium]|nr:hypothetical protein [Lujinxingiaceae bacterium]